MLYFNRSCFPEACDAFEEAVTISPYYYDALFNLRDTYSELGNAVGASECARRLSEMREE